MGIVFYLHFSKIWNVDFASVILEYVEIMLFQIVINEAILNILIVNLEVAKVKFIFGTKQFLHKILRG